MRNKQTILITGSSRGIRRAIAKLAHKHGYKVIFHGKTETTTSFSNFSIILQNMVRKSYLQWKSSRIRLMLSLSKGECLGLRQVFLKVTVAEDSAMHSLHLPYSE